MVTTGFALFVSAGLGLRGRKSCGLAGLRWLLTIEQSGRGLEIDHEFRAFPRTFTEGADRAAVHLDDRFADGESEAEAFLASAALLEGVEDFFEMMWFDPNTGVADFDPQGLGLGIKGADRHGTLAGSKFRRVLQEVPKHLLQARLIRQDDVVR